MTEHRYSIDEREKQLVALVDALGQLIPIVSEIPAFSSFQEPYNTAVLEAQHLLKDGFTQTQLSNLSRSVPDVFSRHRDWSPPLVRLSSGRLVEPEWYLRLEEKLQPVLDAVLKLRELGYY